MNIEITVSDEELKWMNINEGDLISHVIETLDDNSRELSGYTVSVNSVRKLQRAAGKPLLYTGFDLRVRVTYKLPTGSYGLQDDWTVLSIIAI